MAEMIAPQRLDVAPFTESNLYELGYIANWPECRRIVGKMFGPGFAVVDGWSQAIVDDARLRFDSCTGGSPKRNALLLIAASSDADGDDTVLELLLSIGVDPDVNDGDGWRASHLCASMGRLRSTRAILLCRPDMEAKNPNGDTALDAALREAYQGEEKCPERSAARRDVVDFIRNERLHLERKSLSELAVRKVWFAIRNLVRRQIISSAEFEEKSYGKTAAEWAEHFGEQGIAKELHYYASHASAKLSDAYKRIEDLEKKVSVLEGELTEKQDAIDCGKKAALRDKVVAAAKVKAALRDKVAAVAKVKATAEAEKAKLKEQVEFLKVQCVAYGKEVGELSEALAAVTARLPGKHSVPTDEPSAKIHKL